MGRFLQVAIDGFAGVGKSSVAKEVANRHKMLYLDTGSMYRALTYKYLREYRIEDTQDPGSRLVLSDLERLAKRTIIRPTLVGIALDDEDKPLPDAVLRSRQVDRLVAHVAKPEAVRQQMRRIQQDLARGPSPPSASSFQGIVMDGRDIGSKVLPNADLKIFLDASARVRALRRMRQMGEGENDEQLLKKMIADISTRDSQDSARLKEVKSLPDIFVIDTDSYDQKQVSDRILQLVSELESE